MVWGCPSHALGRLGGGCVAAIWYDSERASWWLRRRAGSSATAAAAAAASSAGLDGLQMLLDNGGSGGGRGRLRPSLISVLQKESTGIAQGPRTRQEQDISRPAPARSTRMSTLSSRPWPFTRSRSPCLHRPKAPKPPPSAHASAMLSHSHSPPGPGGALRSSAVCSAAPLGGTLQGCSRFRSTRCYGNGMAQIALPCVHRPEPEPALSDVARKVRRGVAQHTTAKPSAMRATAGPHRHYCHCPLPTAHRPPPTASGAVPLPLPLTLPVYLALAPGPCRRTNSRRRPWAMT